MNKILENITLALLHGDEVPINGLTSVDLDLEYFQRFLIFQ